MNYSLSGSSIHGISQAGILELVAISFSRRPARPRDQTQVSCIGVRFFTIWATREAHNIQIWSHQLEIIIIMLIKFVVVVVYLLSHVWPFVTLWLYHSRLPCPSLPSGVCSNSCPLSQWCCLTISSSAALFSFCLQSFPASGYFSVSQLFTSGGQSLGASSFNISPSNDYTGLISLLSKGLSRVFLSTTACALSDIQWHPWPLPIRYQ